MDQDANPFETFLRTKFQPKFTDERPQQPPSQRIKLDTTRHLADPDLRPHNTGSVRTLLYGYDMDS